VTLDASSTAKLVLLANEIKGRISPQELVTAIESLGFQSPISEFGPSWLRQLSKAGVLDEVCLTITKSSQQSFEEETPSLAIRGLLPESNYELASALEFGNNLFTRWVKAKAPN
jgi:riboflavin biosynthesis pyrimidine reductase